MPQTFRSHAFGKQFRPSSLVRADGAHPAPRIISISGMRLSMPLTFRSQAFAKQLRPSSQEYALNNGARQALRIIGIRAFMHQTFRDHAFGKQFRPSLQENLLMTPTRNCASSAAFHAPNFPKSCVPPQFSKVHTGGANPRMRIISISRIRVSMC